MNSNQVSIIVFGCLYFGFILFTRRKGKFSEFAVASRNVGPFMLFVSLGASFIGPGFTLGFVRDGFNHGAHLAIFTSLNAIVMILMGMFIAPRIRERFPQGISIGDIGAAGIRMTTRSSKSSPVCSSSSCSPPSVSR